ncbi:MULTISPECIES: iron uptake porin [Aerosakkonema]|uniref:iron uptake porin n=1 Tax=Aerosakkonema TaxID=1246629 RepID=UPI0035B9EBE5
MSKTLWNALRLSPVLLGATILVANGTLAAEESSTTIANQPSSNAQQEAGTMLDQIDRYNQPPAIVEPSSNNTSNGTIDQINQYTEQTNGLEQVTSVSQLRDVQPTDWAFQALQSLVERYGCIEGYPDRTYRGNRALTRYEFAAGLNSCLNRIQELIGTIRPDVSAEDLERLRRLQEEFRAELTTLRGRVDTLEARTAKLEAQQFSTTTKLRGEAIFALSSVFGDKAADRDDNENNNPDLQDNAIFADRVRLNFDTSFTGKDRLRTRLQARNITPFSGSVTGTNMTRLGVDGNDDNNNVTLSQLIYRFPLGSRTTVHLIANGGEYNDFFYNFNPLFESSGTGSISRFGRFNPIYRQAEGGAGAAIEHRFSKAISLGLGYMAGAGIANNPTDSFGLFDGNYAAMAQLSFRPSNTFGLGLTYVRSFNNHPGNVNLSGSTGSSIAAQPFGRVATSADHFGLEATLRLSPKFVLSAWGGYTDAHREDGVADQDATIINYAVTLGLPDFGRKGNLLGFVAGQPPRVTDSDAAEDPDTSYHLEAFYRIRVNDNISITPGAFVILNPEHNDNNDTIYVGTVRTTFTF